MDFTHDFRHVDCVRSGSQNAFTERYRKWCKRNRYQFSMEKAAEVYALAKSAVVLVQKTSVTKTLFKKRPTSSRRSRAARKPTAAR